jgi:hypothetical protein
MAMHMIPIARVITHVSAYAQTISAVQYRLLESVEADFIESCITKFVPRYANQLNMIHKLISLVDRPDTISITRTDFSQWGLDNAISIDNDPISYIHFKYLGTDTISIAVMVDWVEAIYAGLHLLRSEMKLKVAQMDRNSALQALADSIIVHLDDDESDTGLVESTDFTAYQIDSDYFII